MSARRMRDPRLPGDDPLEDAEVIIDGQVVRHPGYSEVEKLIIAANHDELTTRRAMWGLDRDDWLIPIEDLRDDGHLDLAILIARKVCDIALTLPQYDRREPDAWMFENLARLHHKAGDHEAEAGVLRQWLEAWPDNRKRLDAARDRIRARLDKGCP